ncbi:MAG: adenosylmethionine--8-amino-7-oxononanoate transaminase [Candidatus Schekmanbacteria bacterium]|nr:adenosylmethionine--8-amino-7-oxononanoate transaminase [Candidatus Schekmanbacteria bacterium]
MTDRNKHLEDIDRKIIWHPFTQMKEYIEEKPLIIERGEGSYLIDINGRKYLDGVASLWVTTHGHRRQEIDEAIIAQVKKISHSTLLGISNVPAVELAEKLSKILPSGLEKIFYSDNGSTAVEISLKISFQYWKQKYPSLPPRTKFVCLNNGYHGDTLGAVSVGGIDLFHELYRPLIFQSYKAPSPYCYRCELGLSYPDCGIACADELEKIVLADRENIAALILEPMVQGAGGMIVFPQGYLKKAREICTRNNILMITDEVAVGFGRTGKMFACEHEGVAPDIMAMSKSITGGYLPLAVTATTPEIFSAFLGGYAEFKTFFHGHTYTGNPLACAAAIASLDIFEREKLIERLQPKIALFKSLLERFKNLKYAGDVRQLGMIAGIELVSDKKTKEPFPLEMKMGYRVIDIAREKGAILRPLGNVIVLMPPLSISESELAQLLDITYESIAEATGE